jgi:hypothetical protein
MEMELVFSLYSLANVRRLRARGRRRLAVRSPIAEKQERKRMAGNARPWIAAAALLIGAAADVPAQITPLGAEFQVNTFTIGRPPPCQTADT